MARTRSVDFLPEIFQTDANKQFLAATLDQLVQEPKFKKTQGFIGRRVGPGVNPNDKYVVETTKTRTDYQLEPGVISLDPADTSEVQDAITYPGILDALQVQGANDARPDRLFSSQYYTWDPFVDFDAFVNFSQYFWVPNGPDVVNVYASVTPLEENFVVTRANSAYTFSDQSGANPTLTLVRGGNYTFQVANNTKETITYRVTANGTASYVINYQDNPTLTLVRGNTYVFTLNLVAEYPFWIKTAPTTGRGDIYSSGVTNNGASVGTVIFTVPQDAPDTLYYAAQNNANMHGQFNIVTAQDTTGPGFWIQTAPGVTGRNPLSSNLSTRDVLGVANNGTNLGTVTFNVPQKTAQNFYYTLTDFGTVDLITSLTYNQINNVPVATFLATHGGIDGIANLDTLTLTFNDTEVTGNEKIYTITYVNVLGVPTITLVETNEIPTLNKFTILYGTEYANTQWYKLESGLLSQIPLLSAVQDTLYYQDSQNPNIVGTIKLVESTGNSVLNIEQILGQTTYTSPVTQQYPSGVTFTNGLKVKFTGDVFPDSYWSGTILVNCYQTIESVNAVVCDTTEGLRRNQPIVFTGNIGGIVAGTTYYINRVISDSQFTISTIPGGSTFVLDGAVSVVTATASFNREYYVSGVGTAIELLPVDNFVVPETYATDANTETVYIEPSNEDYITIDRASKDLNAWTRSNRWFHVDVLTAVGTYNNTPVNLDNNNRARRPIIQFRSGIRIFNMGTEGKQPVNVIDFTELDAFGNIEGSLSYTTNGYTVVDGTRIVFAADVDDNVRNKIYVVNFIVPNSSADTDAGNFRNHCRYTITSLGNTDWNEVAETSAIPSNSLIPGVRYQIASLGTTDWNTVIGSVDSTYVVGDIFVAVSPAPGSGTCSVVYSVGQTLTALNPGSGTGTAVFAEPVINLIPADDADVLVDQSTVCLDGTQEGKTYWYDGNEWSLAQQKTSIQQAPLFNVYDENGYSFSDNSVYPSSDFRGSKLFSYAIGTGAIDPVLQFQLQYQTLENIGDIVFDNNLYKDTFIYTINAVSETGYVSLGYPREYSTRTVYDRLLGWQTGVTTSIMRQQFQFTYNREPFLLDVAVLTNVDTVVPAIKVFVGSVFQNPDTYSVSTTSNTTTISLNGVQTVGELVEIQVISNQTSKTGFYLPPSNLTQNPINANSDYFTLGTIRTHYESICQNLTAFDGPINGPNNTRDLGNLVPYGQLILQQSAPLTMAGYFMRSDKYNIFAALQYNSREYQKYKNKLMDATIQQTINYDISTRELLDIVVSDVILGRTDSNPFYWSDMLPASETYQTTTYTFSYTSTNTFATLYVYNYTSANYQGMNVYINDRILTRDLDYTANVDSASITLSDDAFATLTIGDNIVIQEYQATYGTFVPNTPTKLGLYPAWEPRVIVVRTTSGYAPVIVGHDGSQTPTFGPVTFDENNIPTFTDVRDSVLLEFETRIHNNLKLDGNPVPIELTDVIPGQFRNTGFSETEINNILAESFLSYVGWNKLDYITQDYNAANEFTYNYSQSLSKLDNEPLLGAWRGINRYYYDTQQPEETPWEMLGFTRKPDWWTATYGPSPYTSDNLVLWDDLEAGLVRDPAGDYILPAYVRPGLSKVIPVSSVGELLSPLDAVAGVYADNLFRKSWALGDGGPVEASWWNSSDYPFAAMRLLILTRTAEFFTLFADRDLYRYQAEFDQYLYNNRYRITTRVNSNQPVDTNVQVYGDGVSKASYIDWIVDYNKILGQDSTQALQDDLANIDVRLCYRMASFSDKQYIKIYTEKSSPSSTNTALLIPDESYNLLLYKNQPFARSMYSAVVIQIVEGGWAVYGYSQNNPYFETLTSQPVGQFKTFTVAGTSIQVPANYTNEITQIPYGFVFSSTSGVANFLLSYGKLLEQDGFIFTSQDNGYVLNWDQMVQEFLYWSAQGWGVGTLINLNPSAYKLSLTKEMAVVDSIAAQTAENLVLDQNKQEFPTRNLNIVRYDNTFIAQPLNGQSLSFIDLKFTSYESMIVLDNASLFGDLIYEPITGARQSRMTLIAATTTEWNGSVDAQGFILNQDNIQEWTGLRTYAKGEIVKYKNQYWSAATIVQPTNKFNYSDWNQSNYTLIQQGLLPNLANKADQLANSYNINSANLESDNDLLSYGLIGFRPRQYFTSLNLDDVSQLNVYRQFLDTKGTILSADLLTQADLGKEAADYTIYENWAIQRAVYGANANRNFIDLRLNREYLTSDPVLIQLINPTQASQADQTIMTNQVWKSSFPVTSPDIFPTTTTSVTDVGLPTAGYVNIDDVDITVFQLSDVANISANLNAIQNGTRLWVAKVNDYDWGIYRVQAITGSIQHVCDNLNGTSRAIFSDQHGLNVGDTLIIKFFDVEINGVYKVLGVPDLLTVNIAFSFVGGRTVANGNGIGFTLQTMRVSQASDINSLPYTKQILPGNLIWVDNDGDDLWEVLEKENPFVSRSMIEPDVRQGSGNYGASLSQAADQTVMFVGSPNYLDSGNQVGGIYVYFKTYDGTYAPLAGYTGADQVLTLGATGSRHFGNAVDFGTLRWAVAGASQSLGPTSVEDTGYAAILYLDPVAVATEQPNPFVIWQLLTIPGTTNSSSPGVGEFGYSVAMSRDERWAYIGAPGINQVYAYGRVDWQDQSLSTVTTESTQTLSIADNIQISSPLQATVFVNQLPLTYGVDYSYNFTYSNIIFSTNVNAGSTIVVTRNSTYLFAGGTTSYHVSNYLYGITNIYSCTVFVGTQIQRPGIDYTVAGGYVTFYVAPSALSTITVQAKYYYTLVGTLPYEGSLSAGERFGHSVTCSADGRHVMVGCANATVDGNTEAGSVYVFDRNVQKFIVGPSDTSGTFEPLGSTTAPIAVTLNGQFLVNQTSATVGAAGTFYIDGTAVVLNSEVAVGDVVEIETNQFKQQQLITQNTVADFTNFGQALALCPYNCSLYVGVPQDSTTAWKGGVVQRSVAQAQVYGTTTATVANPVLNVGDTVRVNNVDCVVPAATGSVSSLQGLANNITANAPNATATVSTTGYLTIFVTNSSASPTGAKLFVDPGSVGTAYYDLGFNEFVYTQTIASPLPTDFAAFGSSVDVNDTALTIVVGAPKASLYLPNTFDYDSTLEIPTTIFDGNGTTFFSPVVQSGAVYTFDFFPSDNSSVANPGKFVFGQQIANNTVKEYDLYGTAVNYTSGVLISGAPDHKPIVEAGSFVPGETYVITSVGIVVEAGLFVIGQTYVIRIVGSTDFVAVGAASNTTGVSFTATGRGKGTGDVFYQPTDFVDIGASSNEPGVSFVATGEGTGTGTAYLQEDTGAVFGYENPNRTPAWNVLHQQQPVVDIHLLNSVYMYDRLTSEKTEFFDFIDPIQGKILGAAQQNLDYIGAVDPAEYNVGYLNNNGNKWGYEHVGEMWWDISTVRFLDPNQDNIVYAARRWAQVFPGSVINVYQWVESTQPPATYAGIGTPKSIDSYVISTQLSQTGTFNTFYYFWVKDVTVIYTNQAKTLSSTAVAQYIESPKSSGIPYVAPIDASTVAIYNGLEFVNAADTIISIEFDFELNDANVHAEYELIAQGEPEAFLSDSLYRKLLDSFCGFDTFGNKVPDANLPYSQQYGIQFRPRQSMFINRFLALKNYIVRTNSVMSLYPMREIRNFPLLYSQDPEPSATSGQWNLRVANLEILSYQNIYDVSVGYKYLVVSDSDNNGLWTIYTVVYETGSVTVRKLLLTKVQSYKTDNYWSFVDWYQPGFNSSSKISYEVPNYASLRLLSASVGTVAKVTSNAQGLYEIYLLSDTGWNRVGLQNGTIEISSVIYNYVLGSFGYDAEVFDAQYFDQEPTTETRKILQSINEELFIDDLYIERNKLLTMMFDFILSELEAPEWLVKTSLIDVNHTIRELIPYPNYNLDNQTFVIDYLQEVKPYHVQVREFNLTYKGINDYLGDVTDFDLPAYFDTSLPISQYVSPILLPYTHATYQTFNTNSDALLSSTIWSEWPYSQWIANYLLSVETIKVIDAGSGYLEAPIVTIEGDAVQPAQAVATVDGFGHVTSITVVSPGTGYTTTPTVVISSASGTGAQGYPVMINRSLVDFNAYVYNVIPPVTVSQWEDQTGTTVDLTTVRSPKITMKYDRFQYRTSIVDWSASDSYVVGDRVRFNDAVWIATEDNGPAAEFSLVDWDLVPAGDLTGVDRTMGYYVPGVNEPGLDLPLLVDGVDYPGVQVFGHNFVYADPLDAEYESEFADLYLGTRMSDVNVEGGKFIGPYEGHAPEELVNGAEYDTMDFRIYTRPGSNWSGEGHGFVVGNRRYLVSDDILYYSWSGFEYPINISVSDVNTGLTLVPDVDYTVHWADQQIELITDHNGHTINIDIYEIGGGSQLWRETYLGEMPATLIIPASNEEVDAIIFFVNGVPHNASVWRPYYAPSSTWSITNTYAYNDVVNNAQFDYYRAIKDVPAGISLNNFEYWQASENVVEGQLQFTGPYRNILVTVPVTPAATDSTTVVVMGTTNPPQLSWSTPLTQYFTVDVVIAATKNLVLDNYLGGTNAPNLVVMRNGLRLVPPAGIQWVGDDVTTNFGLPTRMGISQEFVNSADQVLVWLNNNLLQEYLDYTVTPWTGEEDRQVVFLTAPALGSQILISVDTNADYNVNVSSNLITLKTAPDVGDIMSVTTYNDTTDQNLATLVFVGPQYIPIIINQGYNATVYSPVDRGVGADEWVSTDSYTSGVIVYTQEYLEPGVPAPGTLPVFYQSIQPVPADTDISDTSYWVMVNYAELFGSYNYTTAEGGVGIVTNDFDLGRVSLSGSRLLVTLDGQRLFDGIDYDVQGEYLILASGTIGPTQTVVVTELAEITVPDEAAFRIFQDMRGLQVTYRITDNSVTALTQNLSLTDDIIYVANARNLGEPDIATNKFGVVTINGERIVYRYRDVLANTISGLWRGTAGTAVATHNAGAEVIDMGRASVLDSLYQDYISSTTVVANGVSVVYTATNLGIEYYYGLFGTEVVEVYVAGTRLFSGYTVTFNTTVQGYNDTSYSLVDTGAIPPEWNSAQSYTVGSIVYTQTYDTPGVPQTGYQPVFYYARLPVPTGTDIFNEVFWEPVDFENLPGSYNYTPGSSMIVAVFFDDAPADGVEVTILVRHGVTWYQRGLTTPSDGVPLQETQTQPARFLCGH